MVAGATRDEIARLFGRAAFGATGADLDKWTGLPYEQAVASLLPPGPVSSRTPTADEGRRTQLAQDTTKELNGAGRWWLERMRTTAWPLEERLTLFWHDHFATAYPAVPDIGMMMIQNQTLRENAFGDFRVLSKAITVDPAMLIWLNGIANSVNGVNENYGREFLELFNLGVVPQVYTETDIRQASKAFTGWTVDNANRKAVFGPNRHDRSVKSVLCRTIGGYPLADPRNATEYAEVTDAVLGCAGGTAAQFIAYKLVMEFGYLPDKANLAGDLLVQDVATAIRPADPDGRWDLLAGVRTMLLHPVWRTGSNQLVRSPVEVVVHATKVLGVTCDPAGGAAQTGAAANNVPLVVARTMGQALFQPPSVAGWPNEKVWLSPSYDLARYNALNSLATYWKDQHADVATPLPPSGDLAGWARFMGLAGFSTNTTLRLQAYLANAGTTSEPVKQTGMFILVGTSPDWQVM